MIHALPGLGGDHRMFPDPWLTLPGFKAHDWLPYAGQTNLTQVAEAQCRHCAIQDGDTLVGASLGGMVGCEITKIRRIPTLFLVGSALAKDEVNPLLMRAHPLAAYTPFAWIISLAGKVPVEAAQMFSASDPAFVRAMCLAIFAWPGGAAPATRVFRIHGTRDLIIPPPQHIDCPLEGGHLISMTHATECVDYIRALTVGQKQ